MHPLESTPEPPAYSLHLNKCRITVEGEETRPAALSSGLHMCTWPPPPHPHHAHIQTQGVMSLKFYDFLSSSFSSISGSVHTHKCVSCH